MIDKTTQWTSKERKRFAQEIIRVEMLIDLYKSSLVINIRLPVEIVDDKIEVLASD